MYKGYKNILYYKNPENNNIVSNKLTKCSKCKKLNPIIDTQNKVISCVYCGNPIQIGNVFK